MPVTTAAGSGWGVWSDVRSAHDLLAVGPRCCCDAGDSAVVLVCEGPAATPRFSSVPAVGRNC